MKSYSGVLALTGALLLLVTGRLDAQPSLMENLGRGVVAVRSTATEVVVSWRVLGTDPPDVAFNLYRSTAGAAPIRLNASPIDGPTHYVDGTADLTQPNTYHVRPILFGLEQPPSASFTRAGGSPGAGVPARAASGSTRRHDAGRRDLHLQPERHEHRRPGWRRRVRAHRQVGSVERERQLAERLHRHRSISTPTRWPAHGCGASTWDATSAPARITRSSSSTIWTATAGRRSPAGPPTERSMVPAM